MVEDLWAEVNKVETELHERRKQLAAEGKADFIFPGDSNNTDFMEAVTHNLTVDCDDEIYLQLCGRKRELLDRIGNRGRQVLHDAYMSEYVDPNERFI
jgi:hypothetical protein